jgi:hypothetical protein
MKARPAHSIRLERRRGGVCVRYPLRSPASRCLSIYRGREDVIIIAPTFESFLQHLYQSEDLF